jgi:hypothetical protein
MIISKRLIAAAALMAAVFTSCDNDDDAKSESQLSKSEAKAKISSFNASTKSDLQDLGKASGIDAVNDLFDLLRTDDPFGKIGTDKKSIRTFFRAKGKDFRKVFVQPGAVNGKSAGDEPFDFNENKGVYEWNDELQSFVRTGNSDVITIKFPLQNSSTNNGQLILKAYSEVEVYNEEYEETTYEPALLNAELYVDNAKVASLYLEVEWTDAGFPVKASIMATVTPFKLNVEFSDKDATSSYINISLLRNTETLVSTSFTAKYKNNSKDEESLTGVDGFIQVKNLKVQGSVNLEEASKTEVDWNKVVKAALYDDNQKLGDIVFVEEQDGFETYLQYADGSKEKLETALQPVVDELEKLKGDLD